MQRESVELHWRDGMQELLNASHSRALKSPPDHSANVITFTGFLDLAGFQHMPNHMISLLRHGYNTWILLREFLIIAGSRGDNVFTSRPRTGDRRETVDVKFNALGEV